MTRSLNTAFLEPYYGGSHKDFLDALVAHSRHRITPVTMPARKWKWRMRGAAIHLALEATEWARRQGNSAFDLIACSDMLAVGDLRALLPPALRHLPIVCYFHENQLTYPLQPLEERDYQYGMTNVLSCLAADAVWFNSRFHLDDFLAAAGKLLAKMPDFVPRSVIPDIERKSAVMYPPVLLEPARPRPWPPEATDGPLTFLWCHRWEYDKNPTPFLEAMLNLQRTGRSFRLVLLGEELDRAPAEVAKAIARLEPNIVHAGWVEARSDYFEWLERSDVVVSTSIQENFGLAVIEAVLHGCQPLLPDRLVYPEIIPSELHARCLYAGDEALTGRLEELTAGSGRLTADEIVTLQASLCARFGRSAIQAIDDGFDRLASR